MLNLCWSNTKRFLSVLVVFGKYFVFTKIVKFQKQCCPVWRLSCGLIQSHTPVLSPHRDFSWLTGGSMSQSRKILRIFFKFWVFKCFSRLRLAICSRVEGPVVRGTQRFSWLSSQLFRKWNLQSWKTLRKFFKSFLLSVLAAGPGDLHAIWFNRKNRVFCTKWVSFWTFSVFPQIFMTIHYLPHFKPLSNSPCHSQRTSIFTSFQHHSLRKSMGFLIIL